MLVDKEGFTYQKHYQNARKNLTRWKCSKAKRGGCPAKAFTEGNYVIKWIGPHNHFLK